jgi:adenylate cyclase
VPDSVENADDTDNRSAAADDPEETDDTDELVRWLRALGASEAQLEAYADACGGYELQRLAVDLVLNRGADLSVRDLAVRRGIEPAHIVEVLRAYGVAVPDVDAPLFTEADAELFVAFEEAGGFPTADAQVLMRAVANALDRVADAAVALYVQGEEVELLRSGAPPLAWAQKAAHVTELAGRLGVGMGVLFRHHLRQAIDRQRVSQVGVTSADVARMAIGFVDLVGSTALGDTLDVGEFRKLVSEFEARAFEVASRSGGRVVKFIGDEIMVAALDPASGCRLMLALVEACSLTGMQPRGGLSWGEVLFRGGDYYGREVNLASRLVDAAIPGEVLVDAAVVRGAEQEGSTARAADSGLAFERAGRRLLRGFATPVEVWSVTSAQTHGDSLGHPHDPV